MRQINDNAQAWFLQVGVPLVIIATLLCGACPPAKRRHPVGVLVSGEVK